MNLKNLVTKNHWGRVLAIDPASHSLAWAVITKDKQLIAAGKIDLSVEKEQSVKFKKIRKDLVEVVKQYDPDCAVIEQSVYIQNFQTSRIISYIIGFSWGVLSEFCEHVEDVSPLVWKSAIGYKNVNKKDQEVLSKNGKKGSIQIKLKNERKQRVREIVAVSFGKDVQGIEDDDIVDALGIALWYWKVKQ